MWLLIALTLIPLSDTAWSQPDPIEEWHQEYLDHHEGAELVDEIELDQAEPLLKLEKAKLSTLLRLPGMNLERAKALQTYCQLYGAPAHWQELAYLPGWNSALAAQLNPYVDWIRSESTTWPWKAAFSKGRSQLMCRAAYAGSSQELRDTSSKPETLGSPIKVWMRYRYKYKDFIEWGLTAEKDPGEPFFRRGSGGFDAWSAFLCLKNLGAMKRLILGCYRLDFAQGLALSTGFKMGLSPLSRLTQVGFSGVTPYASSAEAGYFHGLATHWSWPSLDLYLFAARTPIDAVVDSWDEYGRARVFTTIKSDGLHRNAKEQATHRATHQYLEGGHADLRLGSCRLGWTAFYHRYSAQYLPDKPLYAQASTPGTHGAVVAMDGEMYLDFWHAFFEVAASENGAVAYLIGQTLQLSSLSWTLQWRDYPHHYKNPFAQALSTHSGVYNEEGLNSKINIDLGRWGQWFWAFDLYSYPNISYRADAAVHAWSTQLHWSKKTRSQNGSILLKYSQKSRNELGSSRLNTVEAYDFWQVRAEFRQALSESWSWSTRMELKYAESALGSLVQQDWQWRSLDERWHLAFRWAVFRVPNFACRIYATETDVLYAMSSKAYYGFGFRSYVYLKWAFTSWGSLSFKIGTHGDMTLQMSYRF